MNKKDLETWNDLYLSVYGEEQLNEGWVDTPKGERFVTSTGEVRRGDPNATLAGPARAVKRFFTQPRLTPAQMRASTSGVPSPTPTEKSQQPVVKPAEAPPALNLPSPAASSAGSAPPRTPAASSSRPAAASGPVLSKKGGVEGTGVGANFKARAFTDAEKSRYSSVAAQNSARSSTSAAASSSRPTSTPAASAPKPPTPAVGKLGSTSFERRTPTSAELRAAQGARDKGASPEKALQAAQKTNLPTTGPSADLATARSSVAAAKATVNSPAVINRPAPAGTALAKQQAQQKLKPPTPMTQSYEWGSTSKLVQGIANAYSSIYEAEKVDQDEDNDNDFADVRIARLIASGVPKEKAIEMVKNKSYNKKNGLGEATAMAKRGYDETEIRNRIANSTGGGEAADRATALENQPTYGNKSKQAAREKLARTQRGDFRRTTSSSPGLHGYGHKSDDPKVKAKQAARGAQRGVLTPREKKQLNREAYETYELVASYLLENNFATTIEDADVIINNMSENWFTQIIEG